MTVHVLLVYINVILASLAAALSIVRYARLREARFLLIFAGSLIFSIAWVSAVAPYALIPTSSWAAFAEGTAIIAWFAACAWKETDARKLVFISCVAFIAASAMVSIFASITGAGFGYAALNALNLALITAIAATVVSRRAPDNHYFIQTLVFIFIATALSIAVSFIGPDAASLVPRVFIAVACAAAFISIMLFTDALMASQLEGKLAADSGKSHVFDATDRIIEDLRLIRTARGAEASPGERLDIISDALEDQLGYSIVLRAGQASRGPMSFDFCPVEKQSNLLSASIAIPDAVTNALKDTDAPILIEDAENNPDIGDPSFKNFGLNSFVLLPIETGGKLRTVLLVGGRRDGAPLDSADLLLLRSLRERVSFAFPESAIGKPLAPESDVDSDTLTNLRNFSSFQKLLSEQIKLADRNGTTFALLLFDTDHFSAVNEKLGYERGDQILKHIGEWLTRHADEDFVGRVGADEFAVLLPGTNESVLGTLERILMGINKNLSEICRDTPVSMSAAYSVYPYDFFEQTGVFGKMREMLSAGGSMPGHVVRVKVG